MARASTRTSLALDRFARIVGYSPILFSGVYINRVNTKLALQAASSCSDPVLQYTWQPGNGGQPGRDEIAGAIRQAEDLIEDIVHFPLLPRWEVDDDATPFRTTPSTSARSLLPYHALSPFYPLGTFYAEPYHLLLRARRFRVLYGGQEAWTLVQAAAAVVYTDQDGDGYAELATVQVNTTVVSPDEICLYYPVTGPVDGPHSPSWEIRPIRVSVNTTLQTATITFDRHQAVQATLIEALDAGGVDGMVDANFLATVDVYRHWNDPSKMAIVEWSPAVYNSASCVGCGGAGCIGCQIGAQTACITQINNHNGIVGIHSADWDAVNLQWTQTFPAWWRRPDRVRLWYRAGFQNKGLTRPTHDLAPELERVVALLGLSLLDRDWMACEPTRNLQAYWRTDLALRDFSPSRSQSFNVSRDLLDNPLGTTRAAMYAWQALKHLRVGQGVMVD